MGYDPAAESNLLKKHCIEEVEDYEYIPAPTELTQHFRDMVEYIEGFVVKLAEKQISCMTCRQNYTEHLNKVVIYWEERTEDFIIPVSM